MASPFARPIPPSFEVIRPHSPAEAADAIRAAASAGKGILARGGGTKWSAGVLPVENAIVLEMGELRGVSEYEPGELTITAGAGTPLAEIVDALSKNGQYLPFDPPFPSPDLSATLGGTVAAG